MAQLINITSEALQATIRRLLPSQQGFGEDLQASNVITPIIDLTPTAEGSELPTYLQNSLAFGSQTEFALQNSSATLANSPGFYRIFGCATASATAGSAVNALVRLSDGLSNKTVWKMELEASSGDLIVSENVDIIVFLRAGDSVTGASNNAEVYFQGSTRQVADVNGNLVNPVGFVSQ